MVEYNGNSTCDPNKEDDDEDCEPITEKIHGGHYDDSYAWAIPAGLEHDSTYQIEAFSSQGQYAISDYFTIISAPTAAPTSAPEGGGGGDDDDDAAGLDAETEVAISSVSAIIGAAGVACCFMCYRSYKTRGRPTAWLYDTHIAMGQLEERASVEMGTISSPIGGGIEADVTMGGPVHQATAAEVSIATAVPMGPVGGKGSDPAQVREVEATMVGAAEELPRNSNVLQVSTKGQEAML